MYHNLSSCYKKGTVKIEMNAELCHGYYLLEALSYSYMFIPEN